MLEYFYLSNARLSSTRRGQYLCCCYCVSGVVLYGNRIVCWLMLANTIPIHDIRRKRIGRDGGCFNMYAITTTRKGEGDV